LTDDRRLTTDDYSVLSALIGDTAAARRVWQRAAELDPSGQGGARARENLATIAAPATPPAAEPPRENVGVASPATVAPGAASSRPSVAPPLGIEPMKAAIAVGDFQVKAANAGSYVGDGLREMLLTALHNSGRFVVLERMDLKGLAAEQALSRSRMARPGEAIPEGRMEVAELMVYGAVTEFEPEVRGGGFSLGMPNVPLTLGMQAKSAHMAVDVRLVDVASGRVLATGRILGEARATQATLGADIRSRGVTMPATFGAFQNTPMEQAIRECVEKAIAYTIANTPAAYFRRS
jgi:curli biogenesis system outer membrane secretion channel CsgG